MSFVMTWQLRPLSDGEILGNSGTGYRGTGVRGSGGWGRWPIRVKLIENRILKFFGITITEKRRNQAMPKASIKPHGNPVTQIAKSPNWTILPQQPITSIECDYRCECDVDQFGVGRVRVKPGYNINVDEIRYTY